MARRPRNLSRPPLFAGSGEVYRGGSMNSEYYRRKARQCLALAITCPEDRAVMTEMATLWIGQAEEAEQRERVVLQLKQPRKEPEDS